MDDGYSPTWRGDVCDALPAAAPAKAMETAELTGRGDRIEIKIDPTAEPDLCGQLFPRRWATPPFDPSALLGALPPGSMPWRACQSTRVWAWARTVVLLCLTAAKLSLHSSGFQTRDVLSAASR